MGCLILTSLATAPDRISFERASHFLCGGVKIILIGGEEYALLSFNHRRFFILCSDHSTAHSRVCSQLYTNVHKLSPRPRNLISRASDTSFIVLFGVNRCAVFRTINSYFYLFYLHLLLWCYSSEDMISCDNLLCFSDMIESSLEVEQC